MDWRSQAELYITDVLPILQCLCSGPLSSVLWELQGTRDMEA